MKKIILLLFLFVLAGTSLAADAVRTAPLLALRTARQGYENVIWMEQRIKIGGESVKGYIQGTGGADDALIGFSFKEDWDMLVATVGYKDDAPEGREVEFFVEADGVTLYSSGVMESKGPSQQIRVPIRGYRNILLRIAAERYNGTAGAAWGAPTVMAGLTKEQMENDWNLSVNNRKTTLPNNSAPSEINLPFVVPVGNDTVEYRVRIRKDTENRTVIVEQEKDEF